MSELTVTPFPLDAKTTAALEKMFWETTDDGRQPVQAVKIDSGYVLPYVGVLRQASTHWCDWLLFRVGALDGLEADSPLLFRTDSKGLDYVPLGKVLKEDAAGEGSCKWDGCREINVDVHECDEGGMVATLRAVAAVANMAGRVAGYEGDEK